MMMFLQCDWDDFSLPAKLVPNATNARFAALHASQLRHKFLSVCAFKPTFRSFMLEFTLKMHCQRQNHQKLKLLTGSVEIESNVPNCRIMFG